jgi:uncharacterized membrane protein
VESIFAFLFKYRPVLFREGDFAFGASWPVATVLGVAGIVALGALVTYAWTGSRSGPPGFAAGPGRRDRLVMGGLRLATFGVLLFCLFRPTLVLTSVVPQRNFVGVLVDDSRSMTLAGEDGESRRDVVGDLLGTGESGEGAELLDALRERFAVRLFRFSGGAERMGSMAEMGWAGTGTDLAGALDRAREELSSVPLSGLVVLSDGADNGGRTLAEALVPLQAASIPVYTVGVGDEIVRPDIQVGRVEVPRRALQGTSLVVDVVVTHAGYAGRTVPLVVEDESRILAEKEIDLAGDGEPTVATVRFTLEEAGPRRLRFRVPVRDGERVDRNNVRDVLVEVVEEREKILYFEGEPRSEVGFLRRAVADDENLQVVVLQRTAENKFLRLSVDDPDELAGGFPKTREELFRYRGLVLGSVEASFFTHDQLAMIADFVGQRGGGFLALGGRNALAEGDYAGTPVAEMLPVILEEPAPDPRGAFTEVSVRPTAAGRDHPATQIRPGVEAAAVWDSLPPLSTLNRIERVKPGATVLLTGETPTGEERVVLAHHRYGRGRAVAFPVQDSWMWQMHADIPLEDPTHENLWRQLLRWVVDGTPQPVDLQPQRERVEPGEVVRLVAEVNDSAYIQVNDARVAATVRAPDGTEEEVPLDWTVERDGEYAGTFTPTGGGEYQIVATARRQESVLGSAAAWVEVGPSDDEYFDAAQRRPVLERIAEGTGGRYYTPASAGNLPEDIQYTGAGVTLTEERDLWDMPILFLLLVALVGAEWGFRRSRGLV